MGGLPTKRNIHRWDQVTFKFGQVSKNVAVDRERSSFSYGINSWESSGAPNALANRTGTASLTLIEKVAS